MAEQSRKFGARVAELRREHKLEQKDLVARMVELGDKGINTNQVSRYEGGEGPMPREARLDSIAAALGTDVADLLAGPVAERTRREASADPFAENEPAWVARLEDKLDAILSRLPDPGLSEVEDAVGDLADEDEGEPGEASGHSPPPLG